MLFIGFLSYCQSGIEKRDKVNQRDYEFTLVSNNSYIVLSKYKSAKINETTLLLKTETEGCAKNQGIYLTLATGENLQFKNAQITCEVAESKKHKLTGSFIVTPELYNKLSKTEILEFKLGDVTVPVQFREKEENLRTLFHFAENY